MHDTDNANVPKKGFAGLFADLIHVLQRGDSVDLDQIAVEHPEFADDLRQLEPTFDLLAGKGPEPAAPSDEQPAIRVLGDYRLRREIGRGGMGIVYEALQISLEKRVALKVLPFAGVLDERSLRRFRNEARAAAQLQHPNIVQVHHMGCDRGIHYYVMQFIEGLNLSDVIRGMQHLSLERRSSSDRLAAHPDASPTASIGSGSCDEDITSDFIPAALPRAGGTGDSNDTNNLLEAMSTKRSSSGPQFFFACARLGSEVAEALQHAHDAGVIHRDIKPSNLLLDRHGKVWITDFGLAQVSGDPGVTVTGNAVGTLRYMSPEQALAKRVVIDHRTDVYSLGATLYELLTLRYVFDGADRQEILRKIAFSEPVPLRKINPRIPRELETIVLKSLAKNPDERYQTAWEMAEDLQSFRQDMPIRARRPTVVQITGKWLRRHRGVAWTAALLTLLIVAGSLTTAGVIWSALGESKRAVASERAARSELAVMLQRSEGLRLVGHSSLTLAENPGLALLLAIEGAERRPGLVANQALLASLDALHEAQTLRGHAAEVGAARFSPSGREAVTTAKLALQGAPAEPARIWDAQSGKQLRTLDDGTRITSAVFSPDEGRMLTAAASIVPSANNANAPEMTSGPPCLWDAVTGRKLLTLEQAQLVEAHPAAFDRQGRRLVAPAADNTARIWDAIGGNEILTLEGHAAPVRFAAFDPTASRVVTLSDDRTARIWSADTGKMIRTFELPDTAQATLWLRSAAFSPDGTKLLTATPRAGVQYWDVESGERLNKSVWPGQQVVVSPLGDRIFSYSRFGNLEVRSALTGAVLYTLGGESRGLTWVDVSNDGRLVLTCADQSDIHLWDAFTGDVVAVLRGHTAPVSFASFGPDGRQVISASDDGTARVWHVQSGAQRARFNASLQGVARPLAAFSPNGRRLLVGTAPTSNTELWNLETGEAAAHLDGRASMPGDSTTHQVTIDAHRVQLWHLPTRKLIGQWDDSAHTFRLARISPDGERVLVITERGLAWLWEPLANRKLQLPGLGERIVTANFHPSGKSVITAGGDGWVRIYDANTGEKLGELQHEGEVRDALFDSSGEKLLAVTSLNRVDIWNYADRRKTVTIRPPDSPLPAARFDATGNRVLTFDLEFTQSIGCWDAETGELLRERRDHTAAVRLTPAAGDHEILIGSKTQGAVLWNLDSGDTRKLTDRPVAAVASSADGQYLALGIHARHVAPQFLPLDGPTLSFGGAEVEIRSTADPEQTRTLTLDRGEIRSLGFAGAGTELVLETWTYGGSVFDVEGQEPEVTFTGHAAPLAAAAFDPEAARLITASWDGRGAIWDAKTGERLHRLLGHEAALTSIAVSADGQIAATGSADGQCRIWNVASGELVDTLRGHADQVWRVALSQDKRRVLTVSRDGSARIWDRVSNQNTSLEESRGLIAYAEFVAEDQGLLTVPDDEFRPRRVEASFGPPVFLLERVSDPQDAEAVRRYDVKLFRQIGAEPVRLAHDQPPKLGRLSPRGDRVLTVTAAGQAIVWDAASGEKIRTIEVDRSPIEFAEFTADGKHLLTGHARQAILWNVADGQQVLAVSDPAGFSYGHSWTMDEPLDCISPDGQWLVTVSRSGAVRRWSLDPLAVARAAAPRSLTAEEKASFEILAPQNPAAQP